MGWEWLTRAKALVSTSTPQIQLTNKFSVDFWFPLEFASGEQAEAATTIHNHRVLFRMCIAKHMAKEMRTVEQAWIYTIGKSMDEEADHD